MSFDTFFSLAELAAHIPKSQAFWRSEVKRGAFGTVGPDGLARSNVVVVDGAFFVGLEGVLAYLAARELPARHAVALLQERERPATRGLAAGGGLVARNAAEVRRKECANG